MMPDNGIEMQKLDAPGQSSLNRNYGLTTRYLGSSKKMSL